VKFLSSKRRVAIALVVVLALFVIRPGASHLKSRIILSISSAVGRPVDIGSVHIRLLPRPGFDLENLVVYDDPAFGAEPMLRASEVTAALRLTSLLRGRLEISRLDLTEPSLNLSHGDNGHWNIESLLERTARIPLAPTGKAKLEPRPGFPYIEGTSGRINLKHGAEKQPYAFTNADFSLWQESDNTWGARLKAQPFRSDMNLNDTGLLQMSATWQRAESIQDMPLQVNLEWNRAQVGQLTKLVTGADQGWRGTILLDVALTGSPAKLQISGYASVDDFRRYDITSGKPLHMSASCDSQYSSLTHEFRQVMCSAPVGNGLITLTGDTGFPGTHQYSFAITAENVPASAFTTLAERVKKNLPDDLTADGTLHATLSMHEDTSTGTALRWQGRGEIADFRLTSAANKSEMGAFTLPFLVAGRQSIRAQQSLHNASAMQSPQGVQIEIGPFPLGGPHAGSPVARGWINRSGYNFQLTGDADIPRTLRLARLLGLPAMTATAEGSARLDLKIGGSWRSPGNESAGFSGPQVTGSAKLRNLQIAARGFGGPVEVVSADLQLRPDSTRVEHLNAKLAGSLWSGSLQLPRGCPTLQLCSVRFTLSANQVALSDLNEWVHPSPKQRPWYRVLEPSAEPHAPLLSSLQGEGRITVDRFRLEKIEAANVSADVSLGSGKLQISNLRGDLLGGQLQGEWAIDSTVKPAMCQGAGSVSGISLADVADAMNDGWVGGTAGAKYELQSTCSGDFWQSAQGVLQVDVRDGILPHISIGDGQDSLRINRLSGKAQLRSGKIEITETKLVSPEGTYQLSGTASLKQDVDLKLTHGSSLTAAGYAIKGTLSDPRVSPLAEVQARLK
jgi:hypothetical protein